MTLVGRLMVGANEITEVPYLVPNGAVTLVLRHADGTSALWHRSPAPIASSPRRCAERAVLGSLSRAEQSVVRLVAEGLTNREIAVRLHVSHRTVDSHVSHSLAKLDMTSRVQLARFVLQHDL